MIIVIGHVPREAQRLCNCFSSGVLGLSSYHATISFFVRVFFFVIVTLEVAEEHLLPASVVLEHLHPLKKTTSSPFPTTIPANKSVSSIRSSDRGGSETHIIAASFLFPQIQAALICFICVACASLCRTHP